MGCGSSSLKGEGPSTIGGDEAPRPVKKVNTNFSNVDYDSGANKARRMTEYAPHETERQKSSADASSGRDPGDPSSPTAGSPAAKSPGDPNHLKPYETVDTNGGHEYPHESIGTSSPQVNGDSSAADPTSSTAKSQFATTNDPANPSNQDPPMEPSPDESEGTKEKKRSWLGQKYRNYSDAKSGRNTSFSDEELKKYTGMDNDEMKKFVKDGQGVGGGQNADGRKFVGPGTGWVAGGDGGAGGGGGI